MTDQHRWDALGSLSDWVQTPNINRIADNGVHFMNCVTNSPVCNAARISLATGLYPHNTGVWGDKRTTLSSSAYTWMQQIRQAGYRTSLFGKTHLHQHDRDLRRCELLLNAYGLDDVNEISGPRASTQEISHMTERWRKLGLLRKYKEDFRERSIIGRHTVRPSVLPLSEYADVYVAQQAKKYIEGYTHHNPWFCWISFSGPHRPWDTPEPYASMYDPSNMPQPIVPNRSSHTRPTGYLDHRIACEPKITSQEISELRANYAGNISLIDDQIGEVLDIIESRKELDNTIIIFTSDHGELNGDYGLIDKGVFLNSATKIPLIIQTPKTASNSNQTRKSSAIIELFDVGPTLVKLAGGKPHTDQYAISFHNLLDSPESEHRVFAYSEVFGEIMYMDHNWKIVLNKSGAPYLLFDLKNDPNEITNLVGHRKFSDKKARLLLKIVKYQKQTASIHNLVIIHE